MTDRVLAILLVEDDVRLAQLTARYFSAHGAHVTIASDGIAGQEEALRGAYDCVVLDVQLPRRDGITVCRALRAAKDVAIVIVSAHGDEMTRTRGLEAGADDVVAKPFSPRELLMRIHASVRHSR